MSSRSLQLRSYRFSKTGPGSGPYLLFFWELFVLLRQDLCQVQVAHLWVDFGIFGSFLHEEPKIWSQGLLREIWVCLEKVEVKGQVSKCVYSGKLSLASMVLPTLRDTDLVKIFKLQVSFYHLAVDFNQRILFKGIVELTVFFFTLIEQGFEPPTNLLAHSFSTKWATVTRPKLTVYVKTIS